MLNRVVVAVPLAYVDAVRATSVDGQKGLLADVSRRVARLGFEPAILATQDPTDNRVVSLLARRRSAPLMERDEVVQITRIEPVAEPPRGTEKADPRNHPFDPGLAVAEVRMIRHALANEYNPRHLWGLAASLEPCFVIAASLLRERKRAVSRQPSPRNDGRPESAEKIRELRARVDRGAAKEGIPPDLVDEEVRRVAFLMATGDEYEDPIPAELQELGKAVLRGRLVDRRSLLVACPPRGGEGVVSPAAIQLAMAASKPEMSRVRTVGRVYERKEEIGRKPTTREEYLDALRTRSVMMRASKAIERHRWLRWYERAAATRT